MPSTSPPVRRAGSAMPGKPINRKIPAAITASWPSLPGHNDDQNLRERRIQDAHIGPESGRPKITCALWA